MQNRFVNLVLVLALVLLVGTGYFVWAKNSRARLKEDISQECSGGKVISDRCAELLEEYRLKYPEEIPGGINQTEQVDQPPQTSGVSTLGWKTYSNSEYGFELKYPNNLISEEEKGVDGTGNKYFLIRIDTKQNLEFECDGCDGPATFFMIFHYRAGNTPAVNCGSPSEISKISVGGVTGTKCLNKDALNGPLVLIYLTTDGVNYYRIQADNYEASRKVLIDEIISTFKFIK